MQVEFEEIIELELWRQWWEYVEQLRDACSRQRTFFWLIVVLIGFSVRGDLLGVTSFVRALGLQERCYHPILAFFHGKGLKLDDLTRIWVQLAIKASPNLLTYQGRILLAADGIKVAKSGRKMPGVKKLHQESDSNTKPAFITGHSCQAIALLAKGGVTTFAIPLAARIHEGLKTTNRDKRSLLDKLIILLDCLQLDRPAVMIADAYYASRKIVLPLLKRGHHLITRVKTNAVGYLPAPIAAVPQRGRPRKYGEKIQLRSLFENEELMREEVSPLDCEEDVILQVRTMDLLWRPVGILVRFVAVIHPTRGRQLLMSTDITMSSQEIIRLYGMRFKIEVTFKHSLHVIGSFLYHFWMQKMKPLKRHAGTQHLHRESPEYRRAIQRKIDAYHRFIQVGLIAQGMTHLLACTCPKLVWGSFGSWLRTVRPGVAPSERVVACALRNTLTEFLADDSCGANFKKFLWERLDLKRSEGLRMVA